MRKLMLLLAFIGLCGFRYGPWQTVSICPADQPATAPLEIVGPIVMTVVGMPAYAPMDVDVICVYQDAKDQPLTLTTIEGIYPGERRETEVVLPREGQCWLLLLAWNECGPSPISQPSERLWVREIKGYMVVYRKTQ